VRTSRFAVLAAVLLSVAACGGRPNPVPPWMRSAETPRDENFRGGPAAMLLKYDANHDGTITRQELADGVRAEFTAHDTGGKGCLTRDQTAEINQERIAADLATASPLQDWNQDGCVDYTEFSAAPYSLFSQLDANHDGKVTPQELVRAGGRKPGAGPARPDGAPPRQ